MTPTPKLRFVERDSYSKNGEHFTHPHKVKILQQWWDEEKWNEERTQILSGEWRDVPQEKEQA